MSNKRYRGDDPTANAAVWRTDGAAHNEETSIGNGVLRFSLPIPPSVNSYYMVTGSGGRARNPRVKDWMDAAQWSITIAAREAAWRMAVGRKLVMEYRVFWPDRRKRDADNLLKALCDAPKGILYDDDQFVLPRCMDVQVDGKRPRVEIELYDMALGGKEA